MQLGPELLAKGAASVLKSTPEEAVVSLDMMVLLMIFTNNASCREIPAPSRPARLFAMMLLVTFTEYHWDGVVGKLSSSEPLIFCKRSPPPLPLSAALPMIRLALMTSPGPAPSLGPTEPSGGTQSASVVTPQGGSTSGEPMIKTPPPLHAIAGLAL